VKSADNQEDSISVNPWEPAKQLRRLNVDEVELSRGFLRCRPERWFPGIAAHWLPFAHALGCEARIVEVKATFGAPSNADLVFRGELDGEPFFLLLDATSAKALAEEVNPGADQIAQDITLEYLARRFIGSLVKSWTGPKLSDIELKRCTEADQASIAGSIKIVGMLNTSHITLWLSLGPSFVEKIDGLWRRQVQSSSKHGLASAVCVMELVQLGVPPQMLAEYLKRQTVVDLEIKASDSITLRLGNKPWVTARLAEVEGCFGCEVQAGPVTVFTVADGMTRLSIEFGRVSLEPGAIPECSQAGAVLTTGVPLGNEVDLVINDEVVARAKLNVYEGRFAITII
jgi:flagellar motor switch/type III secretory pathway protein FliN